jgi:hypothetical protein
VFKRLLMHEKLAVRFCALLCTVAAVFLAAWVFSYFFLPEGFLKGRLAGEALAGEDLAGGSVWMEWLRISAVNLGVMFFVIVAPNVFRTGDTPYGYVTLTLLAVILGITIGTNSFTISAGGKLAPSAEIFASSGLYEIIAYVLAAAATVSISKYRLTGNWPKQKLEVLIPSREQTVVRERTLGLLLAVALLLAACAWEAYRISLAVAS